MSSIGIDKYYDDEPSNKCFGFLCSSKHILPNFFQSCYKKKLEKEINVNEKIKFICYVSSATSKLNRNELSEGAYEIPLFC